MSTFVKIKNVNRTPLRVGSTQIPVNGTPVQIDLDDRKVTRDLYRKIGRWVIVEDSGLKVAKVALLPGAVAGGSLFAWANPEAQPIVVEDVILDIVTGSSNGTSVANIGKAATAVTSGNDLFAAQALNVAGLFKPANKATKLASGDFVTGSAATAAALALVANAYIFYRQV